MERFEPGTLSATNDHFIVDAKCEKGKRSSINDRKFMPLIRVVSTNRLNIFEAEIVKRRS